MRWATRVALLAMITVSPAWAEIPGPGATYGDAIRWYARAAGAGDARAQFLLGIKLESGIEVDRDPVAAAEWFRKAAEQGHPEAQFKLATLLEQGRGVDQNHEAAFRWYSAAAESGLAAAQYNLAVAFLNGRGTEQDIIEAYAWVDLAAEQGLDAAANLRERLRQVLPDDVLAEAQSRADEIRTKPVAN